MIPKAGVDQSKVTISSSKRCMHSFSKLIMVFHFSSNHHCPNVSTTPITAMGCQQCLPLSVVQLKGKHCRKPHCCSGVVDTIRPILILVFQFENMKNSKLHWFLGTFLLETVESMDVTFSQIQGPLPMNTEKPF